MVGPIRRPSVIVKKKTDAVEGAREELERRRSGASYRDRDHQGARAVFAT